MNPQLADTLRCIERGEVDALESDYLAESAAFGGHLTARDLSSYRVAGRRPVHLHLAGVDTYLNPPPAMGGLMVGCMLDHWHSSRGAADGEHLARAQAMAAVDAEWRQAGAALGERFGLSAPGDPAPVVSRGTTHVSVIDAEGRAAAVTVSNGEGNGRIVGKRGFMLNNMLGEENLNPQGFHNWPTGVRLASMMAPTILRFPDGRTMAFGSGGANRIRTAIFQTAAAAIIDGRSPKSLVEAPRLHLENGVLDIECAGDGPQTWPDLDRLLAVWPGAVRWPERSLYFGGVHLVTRGADGEFGGAGDPRRAGIFRIA